MLAEEYDRLEDLAKGYDALDGFNADICRFAFRKMKPYLKGNKCLELGCSSGATTPLLLDHFDHVVGVDGSQTQIDRLYSHLNEISEGKTFDLVCSLIEDLEIEERFPTIVLSFILEHVLDPIVILRKAAEFLEPMGSIFIAVPNANSIHRLMGREMGVISSLEELTPTDLHDGHRRTYTMETLRKDVQAAGLRVVREDGFLFKPLSNSQIETFFSPEMKEALYKLGFYFPQFCSGLFMEVTR